MIVLRPGMSAQPLTGTPQIPTISVRFKDGVAEVEQEDLVSMMIKHPGFNSDFISSENLAVDPYESTRKASEPQHEITEIKFGTPVGLTGDKKQLSPEMQKMVKSLAIEMAKTMLPTMVKDTLESLVKNNKEAKDKPKTRGRKPGRKPKSGKKEVKTDIPEESEETEKNEKEVVS